MLLGIGRLRDRRGLQRQPDAAHHRVPAGELHRSSTTTTAGRSSTAGSRSRTAAIFGVGLGNSTAKWSWLPAADNDFIFAIIGEELGLIGAVVVIGLFVVLAVAFARVLRAARTPFAKAVTAAVLVWVVGQACVNIGVVLGVFPVLGVPLPLVSAGGTALLTTLFAIGVVLSVARDPEAATRAAARAEARAAARAAGRPAR